MTQLKPLCRVVTAQSYNHQQFQPYKQRWKEQETGAGRRRSHCFEISFEEQIMMEAHHMATYGSPEGDDYLSTYVRSHALNEYISLIEQTKSFAPFLSLPASTASATQNGQTLPVPWKQQEPTHWKSTSFPCRPKRISIRFFRTASYRYRKQYQETDFHPRHCETGQQSDQPHRTDQPTLCQRSQCCGIVQPILPAGYQYRHHDIFCRRCIQYSCRLVQRTALDCYRFGTSSSDGLCHFGRCARWKAIVKAILAGASAVELCSVIYQRGNQVIADMTNEMTQWMNRQGYKDISEFKSSMNALSTGASNPFERTQFMKYFSSKE